MLPTGYINQAELATEVERATQKLGPAVVRLSHSVRADTSDEPSIFFRIVLRDHQDSVRRTAPERKLGADSVLQLPEAVGASAVSPFGLGLAWHGLP